LRFIYCIKYAPVYIVFCVLVIYQLLFSQRYEDSPEKPESKSEEKAATTTVSDKKQK